jgi:hypothetical protein
MILTYIKWKMCIKLFFVNIKDAISLTKLAEKIGAYRYDPIFRDVVKYLSDKKALEYQPKPEGFGNIKLVKVNNKILVQIIEETEIYQDVLEFIKIRTGGLYKV